MLSPRIQELQSKRNIVFIERSELDSNKIHGIILHHTPELLLINYIYDFRLDGLMLLRVNDISKIGSSDTEIFQTRLLKDIGLFEQIPFEQNYDFSDYKSAIEVLTPPSKILIIEDEIASAFFIGKLENVTTNSTTIKEFTGTARFLDSTTNIKFSDITSIQFGNNYAIQYSNHFKRCEKDS